MKPIDTMLAMMEYLEKREISLDKEVKRRSIKYEGNKNYDNMILLSASMGASREVKRIMLRTIGYHLKDLKDLATES